MRELKLQAKWEGSSGKVATAANRTREIRPSGMRGGLAETWAMAWAKRARKAETPKQPSLSLMLRAPYFYPTPLSYARPLSPREPFAESA